MSQAPDITGVEGERLDATVTVDSTFSSQQTQTIELRVEDGGTVVHTDTQDVTLQDSTDSQQITLSWPTSSGDKGVYDLFIESGQDTIQRLVEVIENNVATLADNHWRFDAGSGDIATDRLGTFDADFGSAISWASDGDGKGGTYGILDGTDGADLGSASRSHWSHWINDGKGAIGVWINPSNFDPSSDRYKIFGNDDSSVYRAFEFRLGNESGSEAVTFTAGTSSDTGSTIVVSSDPISNDEWTSIAVRADGTDAEMIQDGVAVATASVGDTESGDLQAENISIADPGGSEWEGGIDDFWSAQSDPGRQAIQDWHNATKDNYP